MEKQRMIFDRIEIIILIVVQRASFSSDFKTIVLFDELSMSWTFI